MFYLTFTHNYYFVLLTFLPCLSATVFRNTLCVSFNWALYASNVCFVETVCQQDSQVVTKFLPAMLSLIVDDQARGLASRLPPDDREAALTIIEHSGPPPDAFVTFVQENGVAATIGLYYSLSAGTSSEYLRKESLSDKSRMIISRFNSEAERQDGLDEDSGRSRIVPRRQSIREPVPAHAHRLHDLRHDRRLLRRRLLHDRLRRVFPDGCRPRERLAAHVQAHHARVAQNSAQSSVIAHERSATHASG